MIAEVAAFMDLTRAAMRSSKLSMVASDPVASDRAGEPANDGSRP
jgi:hypothetical protein